MEWSFEIINVEVVKVQTRIAEHSCLGVTKPVQGHERGVKILDILCLDTLMGVLPLGTALPCALVCRDAFRLLFSDIVILVEPSSKQILAKGWPREAF